MSLKLNHHDTKREAEGITWPSGSSVEHVAGSAFPQGRAPVGRDDRAKVEHSGHV